MSKITATRYKAFLFLSPRTSSTRDKATQWESTLAYLYSSSLSDDVSPTVTIVAAFTVALVKKLHNSLVPSLSKILINL